MRHKETRVVCDFCDSQLRVCSGDDLEVSRLIAKRKWVEFKTDFYGNCTEFCSEECKQNWISKMQTEFQITFEATP